MPIVPASVLDLVPVPDGSIPRDALANSLDLARAAERLGYTRYWVAEHHNMPGISGGATSVVLCHIGAGTSAIRIGSGGIMLPNHAPYVIAEQFGTLESLFPGRVDLGLGRAPGTDQVTVRALRRDPMAGNEFPHDVQELQAYFAPVEPGQRVQAVPGGGLRVPLWILGSSTYGAQLAAALGLPYGFASHFAPDDLEVALAIYRDRFQPSEQLAAPYAIAGLNVVAADTDAEATRLFTTAQQAFRNLVRGTPGKLPPPVDDIEQHWSPQEKAGAMRMLRRAVVGSVDTVRTGVEAFVAETGVDEIMVASNIWEHAARRRSYELLAEALGLEPRDASAAPAVAAAPAAPVAARV